MWCADIQTLIGALLAVFTLGVLITIGVIRGRHVAEQEENGEER